MEQKQTYPFQKEPLNYAYNALEPYIDTRTMIIHYEKHYGKYVDNLNAYLEMKPELQGLTLGELIVKHSNDTIIRHNAGGVFNHGFYFSGMRAGTSQIAIGLGGRLMQSIARDFGTVENFRRQFFDVANGVFGSGYAYLCMQNNGRLSIVSTANQDTPLTLGMKPLLCIDVWEHAYYLKRQNERDKYVESFWHLIDWVEVAKRMN